MKKTLVALVALAATGAFAQSSSVTLFGVVDAAVSYGSGSAANKTQLTNSSYNSSRLGFRGTEDLGGGMSAGFWLEAGVQNDNGAGAGTNTNNQATGGAGGATPVALNGGQGLTFNRRSTVSLLGGFGEVRLGRDYTPQFWSLTVFDPFGTNGVGTTQTLNSSIYPSVLLVRASNSVGYLTPKMGGFYGWGQVYMGENADNAANKDDGNGAGLRVGYAAGPLDVALSYSSVKYAGVDNNSTNLGMSYAFGPAKLSAHLTREDNNVNTGTGALIGVNYTMGAGEIRAAYSQYTVNTAVERKTGKFALGYVQNLSKRTALYATVAQVNNDGNAGQTLNGAALKSPNDSATGFDFGIRHAF